MHEGPESELAHLAGSGGPIDRRAQDVLRGLRRWVPFDAAWLALVDSVTTNYVDLASADLDGATLRYLAGPQTAREIVITGVDQRRPPRSLSDLPYPAADLRSWADCLLPAGFREALGVALFEPGGRHVGVIGLFYERGQPPPAISRRRLASVVDVIARGVDPLRTLAAAARLVRGATAGVVMYTNGEVAPLPGLADDGLLSPASLMLTHARARMRAGHVYSAFLWPLADRQNSGGHVRVSVLVAAGQVPISVDGLVLISRSPDLHGLTNRELEVLGLLVDGRSNQEIAQALVVSPRTVAAHVEHILGKLEVPTRTLAAVRAEREGLYVPALARAGRGQVER